MPVADAVMSTADKWRGAAVALGTAILAVAVLRFLLNRRARRLAQTVLRGELTPEADTRLRVVMRLLYALILLFGIGVALSKFDVVRDLGRTLLASGAIAAAVVGFAARQTLANVIAGIMLAVTQPLRVGDHVAFEAEDGVVEDITLSYTRLRTAAGQRIVIPNERLAAGILRNDSIVDAPVAVGVDVWIAPGADVARAVAAVREVAGHDVAVAEATADGVRLTVSGPDASPPDRAAREAELRLAALQRLHQEGLLPGD
jgi:small-conductance mechanosensitive channel